MAAATKASDRRNFLNYKIKNLVLTIVVVILFIRNGTCTSKPIITTLDTKWPSTPLLLEASEYFAKEGNDKFWKFVELTKPFQSHITHLDQYNFIVEVAGKILSPTLLNLFKFSLSIRNYSPTIELFNQVAKQLAIPDCPVFVEVNSQITCKLQEALDIIGNIKESEQTFTYAFDHKYPTSHNSSLTVILYGEVGTQSFFTFHEKFKELTEVGKIQYFLRHFVQNVDTRKTRLSGYGVELAVKNTEYKAVDDSKVQGEDSDIGKDDTVQEKDVDGFLFGKLKQKHPDLDEQLDQLKAHLIENSKVMAPLKVWQLQDLSFQAAQQIMSSDKQNALELFKDISQNLPSKARSLVKTKVSEDFRNEVRENQQIFQQYDIQPGDTELFINGLQLSMDDLNPFSMVEVLKEETRVMDKLSKLGIMKEQFKDILAMSVHNEEDTYAVDMRHDSVVFVNDLEKDQRYRDWPRAITEMLRPTFMGMLRYIAKNIFNLVICIDPVEPTTSTLIEHIDEMVQNSMPIRFGVVLVTVENEKNIDGRTNFAVGLARAFYFIRNDESAEAAFTFLNNIYKSSESGEVPTAEQVYELFKKQYGEEDADDILGPETDHDDLRRSAKMFFDRTGLRHLPQAIMNGVPLDLTEINQFEELLGHAIMEQTGPLQQAIYTGKLSNHVDVYNYLMERPNVVTRLNTIVQDDKKPRVDLFGMRAGRDNLNQDWPYPVPQTVEDVQKLESEELVNYVEENMIYFSGKNVGMTEEHTHKYLNLRPVTNWIVVDLARNEGKALLLSALEQMKVSESNRVGILHNPGDISEVSYSLPVVIEAALQVDVRGQQLLLVDVLKLLTAIDDDHVFTDIDAIMKVINTLQIFDSKKMKEELQNNLDQLNTKVFSHRLFCKKVLNLNPGDVGAVVNGRVLAPLSEKEIFTSADFKLLETIEMDLYARKLREKVDDIRSLRADDVDESTYWSNVIMKVASVLGLRSRKPRQELPFTGKHSVLNYVDEEKPALDVLAIVDPLSNNAQKLIAFLTVLQNVTTLDLKVFMNCREKLSEMPLKRFYRYVLEPSVTFNEDGSVANGPSSVFRDIPETPLLTMNLDIPQAWMVEAVKSPYDLDNIYLTEVEQAVHGHFELEYILIEGHCSDANTGQPPRGLQFILGTKSEPEMFDTIVMANLGYFQLKASPGSWMLQLRKGRSRDIFDIESISGSSVAKHGEKVVDSFLGEFIQVKVKRRAGMATADLLADDEHDDNVGLWDSLSSMVGGKPSSSSNETINIFSVASGHLYERFLRIMMLTVMKNTKSPVKFWFLKNYLSPTFQAFVPHMAKEYGFAFEFVQYKWPSWLHHQTEKQRVIWGYKILFLDVLFPLHLKKIIFVDADLIVRTDLKELMDLDLERAAYAYTPFCESRTEMDGFRFWKHGYWKNHLGHRPYHISALYVIDLKRFRRIAAGDRLRGQYQGLSQDPNSLSNLDQDLPNNMIHQVPMKSLPQEWLWCETWCDDASKSKAKAIDLCNNPQTKEPKLKSAVRIVKEWPDYDNEIRRLQERVTSGAGKAGGQHIADTSARAKEEL